MIKFPRVSSVLSFVALVVVVLACSDETKAKPNFVQKTQPHVVAKIGGEEITEEQLIGDDRELRDLAKKTYMYRMERLNKVYVDKILGAEAKKANLSLNDYIDKKVLGGKKPAIGDKEYKKFLQDRRIPESQVDAATKERIMSFMQGLKRFDLALAAAVKQGKGVESEVYFSRPKYVVNVDAGNGPSFGPKDAKITIVEFSDFQCPFCSRAAETVNQIKKKYGSKVRLVFRHYPLPSHPNARPAAEASLCVNEQSTDKFWAFHDLMFKNQDKLDAANLEKYAKDVGADVKKFGDCVSSKKFATAVNQDAEYGNSVGVAATPTFFINGEMLDGAQPIEAFSEIIDDALKKGA